MPPATAELITGAVNGDTSYIGSLEESSTGWNGRRCWRANTRSEYLAATAVGVPRRGDAWSTELPQLLAQSIKTQVLEGDLSIVEVKYAENDPNRFEPAALAPEDIGVVRTEARPSSSTVTVRLDVNGEAIPAQTTVNKEVTTLEFVVFAYFTPAQAVASFAAWLQVEKHVNSGALTLPNFMDSGQNVVVPAGRLFVRDIQPRHVDEGITEMAVTLGYCEDWLADWVKVDDEDVIQAQGEVQVYPTTSPASIALIWSTPQP